MLNLRRLGPDDWREWRAVRLQALADAPYAFESKLDDWLPAPEQRWRDRLSIGSYDLLADLDGRPAGMASGIAEGYGPPFLISMWVAPFARRRGVGTALIDAVAEWARTVRPGELRLQVVDGNEPAIRMYKRNGFVDLGVVPGLEPVERLMARPNPMPVSVPD